MFRTIVPSNFYDKAFGKKGFFSGTEIKFAIRVYDQQSITVASERVVFAGDCIGHNEIKAFVFQFRLGVGPPSVRGAPAPLPRPGGELGPDPRRHGISRRVPP